MSDRLHTLSGYLYEYQKSVSQPEEFWARIAAHTLPFITYHLFISSLSFILMEFFLSSLHTLATFQYLLISFLPPDPAPLPLKITITIIYRLPSYRLPTTQSCMRKSNPSYRTSSQ